MVKMKPKRFKLIHFVSREEFYRLKKLDAFEGRIAYNKIRKELYLKSKDIVLNYKNKNIISKWWNDYYKLKDLTENHTYLDIDVEWWENPKDSLVRAFSGMVMHHMKKEGLI